MLEAGRLLEEARERTGLEDYGDMGFAEGMGVLVNSINEEAGLTPEHEALLKEEFDRLLANRLRMQRDISEHPEILEEEVLPPIFITSMPRTGSTKLHRMLAATGDFNALRYWHSLNFAPFPEGNGAEPDPRIGAAYEHLERIYEHAPNFQRAHPMYAEEAEEELALLDAGFNSLYRWAALLNVPSYIEFVLGSDPVAAFQDLRRMIQYLQWQHFRGLGHRWVFKTPSLFGFEAVYSMVFEGTDFIVTHRHPERTMASTCFLACGSRELYSEQDFSPVIAQMVLGNFSQALERHLAWREAYPPEKVLDVSFPEVLSDEVRIARTIYDFLGMQWTDRAEKNLRTWLEMDTTRGHESSTAKLEDYGLTAEQVNQAFGPYIERYREFL
jgi:hypothetical protein